ncbi:hypothetical protein LWP59_03050 [Amycolatopsis acidiphila]|uniref:Uncharacterized protein n=1 Tax=Amycolatopsis acidiphila TaxID=715473 RepID=A0A558A0V3_9PSEU|nr:hypothetical protein [Amycolatopsis acidiphila]TVT17886.1 hypothetical protein FNH06_29610 [Amycolatopsis acidiphila]UIJ60676.1 hypothetical protein LWP59_03050 [Amycolatopsis acidiphila]GHG91485.1 hypothetical protein GCM10017788_67800 [Amycolatopsis acidiphila]
MSFDVSGVVGAIVVVPLVLWVGYLLLSPVVFRRLLLPQLARQHGWRVRKGRSRAPRDLPGDGGQSWEVPLPDTVCEFLGRYRGRPVHGVQVSVTRGDGYDTTTGTWSANSTSYSVVTVATGDRPFAGFHDRNRATAVNGDPIALYPDFTEWARNRKPETRTDVRQEGHGFRSVSWRGGLKRKRLLRALDELTA